MVKKDTFKWHKQNEEDIYDLFPHGSWGMHHFACVMDDGTLQEFTGMLDENCDGEINLHINAVNDEYDDVDRIVMWVEIPSGKSVGDSEKTLKSFLELPKDDEERLREEKERERILKLWEPPKESVHWTDEQWRQWEGAFS